LPSPLCEVNVEKNVSERERETRKTEPKAKTCQLKNKIRNNMLQFVLSECVLSQTRRLVSKCAPAHPLSKG